MNTLPRLIKPELVEIGDLVNIELPKVKGVTHFKRGRVAKRTDHGDLRSYHTAEGAILFTWQPNTPRLIKVTLIERQAAPQEPLFNSQLELDKRFAS